MPAGVSLEVTPQAKPDTSFPNVGVRVEYSMLSGTGSLGRFFRSGKHYCVPYLL